MEVPRLRRWAGTARTIHFIFVQTWTFALLSRKGTQHRGFLWRSPALDRHSHEERNRAHPRVEKFLQQEKPRGSFEENGEGFVRKNLNKKPGNFQRIATQRTQERTKIVLTAHQRNSHQIDRITLNRRNFHRKPRPFRHCEDVAQGIKRRRGWRRYRGSDRRYLGRNCHRIRLRTEQEAGEGQFGQNIWGELRAGHGLVRRETDKEGEQEGSQERTAHSPITGRITPVKINCSCTENNPQQEQVIKHTYIPSQT